MPKEPIVFYGVVEGEWTTTHSRKPFTSVCATLFVNDLRDKDLVESVLSEIGWYAPPFRAPMVADCKGIYSLDFVKNGSGVFNGWTDIESKDNITELREAFARMGFRNMKPRTLSVAERI